MSTFLWVLVAFLAYVTLVFLFWAVVRAGAMADRVEAPRVRVVERRPR